MRKLIFIAVWMGLMAPAFAQMVSIENLQKHIYTLASDDYQGRGTGEKGEDKAAKYIAKQLKKLKLDPKGTKKYYQPFSFNLKLMNPENPHGPMVDKGEVKGKNVIGWVDNAAQYTVVIGAHYDHLGEGALGGSREANPDGKIHHGADDNASGVAAMLELARILQSNGKIEEHNYLFIFFSGEEEGLQGSKYWAENPTVPLESIHYMIHMDMVGRMDSITRTLVVHGVGTNPNFGAWLNNANSKDLSLVFDSTGVGPSDFTSFYRKEIPVLGFFTGQHADYHKETDTPDKINYKGEKEVIEFILNMVHQLDTMPKLVYQKTKEPQMGRTKFKVTMGIMPDYTFSGEGVKVDGVSDDKPAFNAGIKAGDIIIRVGDMDIKDMSDYMKLLGSLNPGDQRLVKVQRGEEILELNITF
ncbi:MAG: M20/M25/M40 family metallo-hydrolase [Bacteroidota bacterium]|nr:M20/M25/M40 family metallo-hydrolase [Bacteroidota bacterium]MDX5430453.1 M20/M25/M40 family metallo-hydrolase [Bacteroidota bacterium]MDX5469212.1 M20/M25/M40 family metallo-hydrolase [Bacteroidota bacterium]